MAMDIADGPLQGGAWTITPDMSRVYDHWLGGSRSYQPDRDLAARLEEACEAWPGCPPLRELAARDRCYVLRAVQSAAAAGIRQVIDISAGFPGRYKSPWPGVPSLGPAYEAAPGIRAAYVTGTPESYATVRGMLDGDEAAVAVAAHPRDPEKALADPALREAVDLNLPVVLLASRTLQFLDVDDAADVAAGWMAGLAPGSRLVATITRCENQAMWEEVRALVPGCWNHTATDMRLWFAAAKLRLQGDIEVARGWAPERVGAPAPICIYGGAGMKA